MAQWNPAEYASHSSAQLGWARELMVRLELRGDESILDIGCGDGKITAEIARHLPNGFVVGTDQSADMIDFARKTFPPDKSPNLEFIQMDARELRLDRAFDLAFSNATLHWVDDHRAVLRGVHDLLKPGGRIVFSFGGKGNADAVLQVVHQFMHHDPWRPFFETFTFRYVFPGPEEYIPLLEECGFRTSVCRLVPKDMVHGGAEGLAGWVRTTWLPYTQRVLEDRREAFIAEIVNRYLELHPPDAEGRVHVPMVRLEIDAVRD